MHQMLASRRAAAGKGAPDVEPLLRTYANDGESALSIARALICATFMVRYWCVAGPAHGTAPGLVLAHLGRMFAGVLISLWLWRRARHHRLGPSALLACTAGEVVLCSLALRANVLRPPPHYAGILRMPDLVFPVVMVFASGLRLYWRVILGSLVLNAATIGLLVRFDRAVNGGSITFSPNDAQMIAIEVVAAGAAACICAWAARRAIQRVAVESERAARGRRHLDEVLREHHDVRTLLSSARLHLDLLRREITRPGHEARLAEIERAMVGVGGTLERVKAQTLGEIAVSDELVEVAPLPIVEGAVSVARERFSGVRISVSCTGDIPPVLLLGGQRAFAHVIINLLMNACEGNGSQRADDVQVRIAPQPWNASQAVFEFVDDGPGFRDGILSTSLRGGLTTKAGGTGVGLSLVAGLVEASGGKIEIRNRSGGGACVSMSLPLARRA